VELEKVIKALAHKNRLRILNLLKESRLCVCELSYILAINQSNLSRHLRRLKEVGLVKGEREGKWIYYSLVDSFLADYSFVEQLIKQEFKEEIFLREFKKLKKYLASDMGCEYFTEKS